MGGVKWELEVGSLECEAQHDEKNMRNITRSVHSGCGVCYDRNETMENLTDQEITTLLEALNIARNVTISSPAEENGRLYVETESLWQKVGIEALSRGIEGYVELDLNSDSPRVEEGEYLDDNSESSLALAWHNIERFSLSFSTTAAEIAIENFGPTNFKDLPHEERVKFSCAFITSAREIFENNGLPPFLDTRCVFDNVDLSKLK